MKKRPWPYCVKLRNQWIIDVYVNVSFFSKKATGIPFRDLQNSLLQST